MKVRPILEHPGSTESVCVCDSWQLDNVLNSVCRLFWVSILLTIHFAAVIDPNAVAADSARLSPLNRYHFWQLNSIWQRNRTHTLPEMDIARA